MGESGSKRCYDGTGSDEELGNKKFLEKERVELIDEIFWEMSGDDENDRM